MTRARVHRIVDVERELSSDDSIGSGRFFRRRSGDNQRNFGQPRCFGKKDPQGVLRVGQTLGSRLAAAVCLRFALISVGIHVSMGIVLIAYVVSILASTIPLLPGGLGLVEATIPGLLHHYGVSLDTAVAGTIAWRGVTLLLPGLVGLAGYASLRRQSPGSFPVGAGP